MRSSAWCGITCEPLANVSKTVKPGANRSGLGRSFRSNVLPNAGASNTKWWVGDFPKFSSVPEERFARTVWYEG